MTEGHPDKIADQISDAILDEILRNDPYGRVACETLVTTGLCTVAGEISTSTYVDIPKIVRQTIVDVGYDRAKYGFDGHTCGVSVAVQEQSQDIAQGVDEAIEVRTGDKEDELDLLGAGDQGMMFGYACDEGVHTELMPTPIWLAHRMAQRLSEVRKADVLPYLRPDGKTQVTIEYEGQRVRSGSTPCSISTQHADGIDIDTLLRPDLVEHVIRPIVPAGAVGRQGPRPREPDRTVRDRRPARRHRAHRTQDRRRHLRRHGTCRWRLFLRQGPDEGRPDGRLRARGTSRSTSSRPVRPIACEVGLAYAIGTAHPVSIMVEDVRDGEGRPRQALEARAWTSSTCVRRRSSATSICAVRSTSRRRRTGTSAGPRRTSPGSVDRLDEFKAGVESL